MSAIELPPITHEPPKKAAIALKASRTPKFGVNAVGIWSMTYSNRVAMYTFVFPMAGTSERPAQSILPMLKKMSEIVSPQVATK
jgi:hypothetical protein